MGHFPLVIWLTGLSGSGKSTLANALERALVSKKIKTALLDGDNLRHGLNKDLGFTSKDRTENIRRAAEVCHLFYNAGLVVIASFISPFEKDRQFAQSLFPSGDFLEVYVRCPLEVCEARDVKGLYAKAKNNEVKLMTGIASQYEEPRNPNIVVETDTLSVQEGVGKILDHLKSLGLFNGS